eukprot:TRINITY_DN1751_c0_g3_i1.p1 TRINITY_DN1751_c0_g3~~TRINITY_DN1751_c0_g3_i1.p1  ORF type:complete len:793 (-),score=60.66 TRINITY_DN1751_c0_g3_i1:1460-3838(-)
MIGEIEVAQEKATEKEQQIETAGLQLGEQEAGTSMEDTIRSVITHDEEQQILAINKLLERLKLPVELFQLSVQKIGQFGGFKAYVADGKIHIEGQSGVDIATGIHWFLKYRCNSSYSWPETGGLQLAPDAFDEKRLNRVSYQKPLIQERTVKYHYYQNVVTSSYSFAYWQWDRWQQELDWMAMNGVNLALALSGQEYVWAQVYNSIGIETAQLANFFAGPSFLAWGRMGNIQGYGGPLPHTYIRDQSNLQARILGRMRELGIQPVVPGFSGFVPRAFRQKFPDVHVIESSNWCDFPSEFANVLLLDPQDPWFRKLGSMFISSYREIYGQDPQGFYQADVFNEMQPQEESLSYFTDVSRSVYESMSSADSSAVWLMQAWLFYDDPKFWYSDRIRALLNGVPTNRLLLLDLYAEEHPLWKTTESFYNTQFIWCMLHNFGGNLEMYGDVNSITKGPYEALKEASSMTGTGICPEGIFQNPMIYELMNEICFRANPPELRRWQREYTMRRYRGLANLPCTRAWRIILQSAYNATDHHISHCRDIPISRPGIDPSETLYGLKPHMWYSQSMMVSAWRLLLEGGVRSEALRKTETYMYDVVDVTRQVLSKAGTPMWHDIVSAYQHDDYAKLRTAGECLLELMDDLDEILNCHKGFLLGTYLKQVRQYPGTQADKNLYESNFRTQITIWGTTDEGVTELCDYANKMWGGLMKDFYKERWALWLDLLKDDLSRNTPYDKDMVAFLIVNFIREWVIKRNDFPTDRQGYAFQVSAKLYNKYSRNGYLSRLRRGCHSIICPIQ